MQLSKIEYQTTKSFETLNNLCTSDIPSLKETVSQLESKSRSHDLTLDDNVTQVTLMKRSIEEAFGRIGSLDRFTDRSLPVLIDQSISTYLQEFLSVPDKL